MIDSQRAEKIEDKELDSLGRKESLAKNSLQILRGQIDFSELSVKGSQNLPRPDCKSQAAKELQKLVEDFRQDASVLEASKYSRLLSSEPELLSKKKMCSLFFSLEKKLSAYDSFVPTKQLKRDLRFLKQLVNEAKCFVLTRPLRIVNFQFPSMVRTILDMGTHIVSSIDQTLGNGTREKIIVSTGEIDEITKAIEYSRHLSKNLRLPRGSVSEEEAKKHFIKIKELHYVQEPRNFASARYGRSSILSRNMTRSFFSEQAAQIFTIKSAIDNFVNQNDLINLGFLQGMVSDIDKHCKSTRDLTKKISSEQTNSFRVLVNDLKVYLSSVSVQMHSDSKVVRETLKQFSKILEFAHIEESWCTFGAQLFRPDAIDSFQDQVRASAASFSGRLEVLFNKLFPRDALQADTLIFFRYSGSSDAGNWQEFKKEQEKIKNLGSYSDLPGGLNYINKKALKSLEKVQACANQTVTGMQKLLQRHVPKESPVYISRFQKSRSTALPENLLDQIMDLQTYSMTNGKAGQAQLGLATPMTRSDLKERIEQFDASVFCQIQDDKVLSALLCCANEQCMPPHGTELKNIFASYLEKKSNEIRRSHIYAPIIIADFFVGNSEANNVVKFFGEDPNYLIHEQLKTYVYSQFSLETVVHCLAVCRRVDGDNLAKDTLERMGYKTLQGVGYTDRDGIQYHVLDLEIRPLDEYLS